MSLLSYVGLLMMRKSNNINVSVAQLHTNWCPEASLYRRIKAKYGNHQQIYMLFIKITTGPLVIWTSVLYKRLTRRHEVQLDTTVQEILNVSCFSKRNQSAQMSWNEVFKIKVKIIYLMSSQEGSWIRLSNPALKCQGG